MANLGSLFIYNLNSRISYLLPVYQEQSFYFAEKRSLLESIAQQVEGMLNLCSEVRSPSLTQRVEPCQEQLNGFIKDLADRKELIASRESEVNRAVERMRIYSEIDKDNSTEVFRTALEVKALIENVDELGNWAVIEFVPYLTDTVSRYLESREPELQFLRNLEDVFGNSKTSEGHPMGLYFNREEESLVGLILHPLPEGLAIVPIEKIFNPYIANSEQVPWREDFLESVIRKQVKGESWVIAYDQKKGAMALFPKKAELCDSKIRFLALDPGLGPYLCLESL